MKCILLKSGDVVRVRNWQAYELRAAGKGCFAPKHIFKHKHGLQNGEEFVCKDAFCSLCK
jgi:hypothetical protein